MRREGDWRITTIVYERIRFSPGTFPTNYQRSWDVVHDFARPFVTAIGSNLTRGSISIALARLKMSRSPLFSIIHQSEHPIERLWYRSSFRSLPIEPEDRLGAAGNIMGTNRGNLLILPRKPVAKSLDYKPNPSIAEQPTPSFRVTSKAKLFSCFFALTRRRRGIIRVHTRYLGGFCLLEFNSQLIVLCDVVPHLRTCSDQIILNLRRV